MKFISSKKVLPKSGRFVLMCVVSSNSFFGVEQRPLQTYYLGWRENPNGITCPETPWFAEGHGQWFSDVQVSHWCSLPVRPRVKLSTKIQHTTTASQN